MKTVKLSLVSNNDASRDEEISELIMPVLNEVAELEDMSFHVTVLLADEDTIRELNRSFRGVDRVTDVLSFPASEFHGKLADHIAAGGAAEEIDGLTDLGDIALCIARAAQQAEDLGHTVDQELMFLAMHGALHLMGYDHETENDEEEMTAMQRRIMDRVRNRRCGT